VGDSIGPLLKKLAVVLVVGTLVILFYHVATVAHDHQVTYDTYLSVTLTALAIILAVVGILIAILAFWGYNAIRQEARNSAVAAAEAAILKHLDPEKIEAKLRAMVQDRVKPQDVAIPEQGTPGMLTKKYPAKREKGAKI
jgi:H+/Cl- antiporter ClcA